MGAEAAHFFPYPTIFSFFWQSLLDEFILRSKHQVVIKRVGALLNSSGASCCSPVGKRERVKTGFIVSSFVVFYILAENVPREQKTCRLERMLQ